MNFTPAGKTENGKNPLFGSVGNGLSGLVRGRENTGASREFSKAQAFWTRKAELRKKSGVCGRCCKPSETRTCPACQAYAKTYKARKQAIPASVALPTIEALLRRVASLEIAVANMQYHNREAYKRGYRAGTRNIRNRLARRVEGLAGEHSAHRQNCKVEMNQISHAYGKREI